MSLPSSINYSETIPGLPENVKSTSVCSTPVNGSSFTPSSIIMVDLLRKAIVPDSIYIRYKVTTDASVTTEMIGTPVYTPIAKLETLVGSQNIDTINQYNQTANLLVNLTQDIGSKYGLQAAYGYDNQGANGNLALMDGKRMTANETYFVSAPLPCMLTSCEKIIPGFAMPTIRFQFTLDSLANMFAVLSTTTAFTISNFEICYTIVDFGSEIENMIMQQPVIHLKSQSFYNGATVLPAATSGAVTIPYNVSFASIKSLFCNFSGTHANSVNKWGDSYDLSAGNGDYSFSVGGIQYPQRVLSTTLNKAGILQELRKAVGSIYGSTNSLSINSFEFNRSGIAVATSSSEPAKFWVGVSTEKLHTHALLTGISSQGSAILLNMNIGTATTQSHNINLIVNYDAILEIDTQNMMVNVKK